MVFLRRVSNSKCAPMLQAPSNSQRGGTSIGFVIDCDGVSGAMDLLVQIRGSRSNKTSVVVAVVSGTTSVSTAVDAGANFVLGKPVLDRQLQSLLDVALPRDGTRAPQIFSPQG
jgi:hypothetical protein